MLPAPVHVSVGQVTDPPKLRLNIMSATPREWQSAHTELSAYLQRCAAAGAVQQAILTYDAMTQELLNALWAQHFPGERRGADRPISNAELCVLYERRATPEHLTCAWTEVVAGRHLTPITGMNDYRALFVAFVRWRAEFRQHGCEIEQVRGRQLRVFFEFALVEERGAYLVPASALRSMLAAILESVCPVLNVPSSFEWSDFTSCVSGAPWNLALNGGLQVPRLSTTSEQEAARRALVQGTAGGRPPVRVADASPSFSRPLHLGRAVRGATSSFAPPVSSSTSFPRRLDFAQAEPRTALSASSSVAPAPKSWASTVPPTRAELRAEGRCFTCHQPGHTAADCPQAGRGAATGAGPPPSTGGRPPLRFVDDRNVTRRGSPGRRSHAVAWAGVGETLQAMGPEYAAYLGDGFEARAYFDSQSSADLYAGAQLVDALIDAGVISDVNFTGVADVVSVGSQHIDASTYQVQFSTEPGGEPVSAELVVADAPLPFGEALLIGGALAPQLGLGAAPPRDA